MYSEKVLEHFRNPRNLGKIENADGVGKIGNPVCGDVMHVYIKVKSGKIADIKFETFGCAAAIATSSMITELARGKTIEDALKVSRDDISSELGGLPPIKEHCSNLAADALAEAIYGYLLRQKLSVPASLAKRHEQIQRNQGGHGHE
jgi:nitrogen fixation NifU-like protein